MNKSKEYNVYNIHHLLIKKNFTKVESFENKSYYTNRKGLQVRVDTPNKLITFIDKKGFTIENNTVYSSEYVDNLIEQYKNENK